MGQSGALECQLQILPKWFRLLNGILEYKVPKALQKIPRTRSRNNHVFHSLLPRPTDVSTLLVLHCHEHHDFDMDAATSGSSQYLDSLCDSLLRIRFSNTDPISGSNRVASRILRSWIDSSTAIIGKILCLVNTHQSLRTPFPTPIPTNLPSCSLDLIVQVITMMQARKDIVFLSFSGHQQLPPSFSTNYIFISQWRPLLGFSCTYDSSLTAV